MTASDCLPTTPFLSKWWLESWFGAISTPLSAYVQYRDEKPVCFSLIGTQYKRKYGVSFKVALLNQTGAQQDDQVWIEYNSLIGPKRYHQEYIESLLETLSMRGYDTFYASMITPGLQAILNARPDHIESEECYGYIATISGKSSLDAYYPDLSPNSRSKLKRSQKKITEKYGELAVTTAQTNEEYQDYFDQLAELHIQRWGKSAQGSGFNNPSFVSTLLALNNADQQHMEIVKICAGDHVLGYSLNLLLDKTVFFYCSGIDHGIATSHIKPGYTLHLHLMTHYASRGFNHYDFMGGESQYKKTLANQSVSFFNTQSYLKTLKGRLLGIKKRILP